MARDETRVLGLSVLRNDAEALAAIQNMEGYKSSVPEFELAKLEKAEAELRKADALFAQTEAAWQSARDARVTAQWAFHNAILGAKRQVLALFGDDSDEAQTLKLVKKSERSAPVRKAQAATAGAVQ